MKDRLCSSRFDRIGAVGALAVVCCCVGCEPPNISIDEAPLTVTEQVEGFGPSVRKHDMVKVDYVIEMPDGSVLMQQDDYRFKVGENAVIRGIDEAVVGMRPGGEKVFTCPPDKHWGRQGYANGRIPPKTTLVVRLKLVSIL